MDPGNRYYGSILQVSVAKKSRFPAGHSYLLGSKEQHVLAEVGKTRDLFWVTQIAWIRMTKLIVRGSLYFPHCLGNVSHLL